MRFSYTRLRQFVPLLALLAFIGMYDFVSRVLVVSNSQLIVIPEFDSLKATRVFPGDSALELSENWFVSEITGQAKQQSELPPELPAEVEGTVKNLVAEGAIYRLVGVFDEIDSDLFAILQSVKVGDKSKQATLNKVGVGDLVGEYRVVAINLNSVALVAPDQREVELIIFETTQSKSSVQ
jgi:hypothetical protein